MEEKSAYTMPNAELVEKFMNACARAGSSNSGLAIDVMAGTYLEEAHYHKGAVLARLDGKQPPFVRGMKVRVNEGTAFPRKYGPPHLEQDKVQTVDRVWYDHNKWYLTFRELARSYSESSAQYKAGDFSLAESGEPVPVAF